ncbi:hypothetical protein ElyMa_000905400 [Elysia marginata]|uniref:Secreted peptide n=1 Tax=Elysia marginata TaxID=1093978 RepID=A0AAV4HAX7_9GAST|nr:hypothetical protein ElyMa_000905400 [Elysia marginata]
MKTRVDSLELVLPVMSLLTILRIKVVWPKTKPQQNTLVVATAAAAVVKVVATAAVVKVVSAVVVLVVLIEVVVVLVVH